MAAKILLSCVAIILICYGNAEYDVARYCGFVSPNTKLPSLESCQVYYICQPNGKPLKVNCPDYTEFSKTAGSCIEDSSESCSFDRSNPCKFKHDEFAPSASGCNMWNYCANGKILGSGSCPRFQIFDPITGECVYGECNSDANNSSEVTNVCQIMPDNQYFGDSKDCSAWYLCNGFSLTKGHCEDGLVFDTQSGMCLKDNGNMCQRTNNIVKIQPGGPPEEDCTSINDIAADTKVCSIYYICRPAPKAPANTFQWIQRSCQFQYFDVISKKCNGTSLARAYPGCDRCQFTTGYPYWVNAVTSSCSEYNTCNQGRMVTTAPVSCGSEEFYNEDLQSCIKGDFTLGRYTMTHGACQDYLCNDDRVCSFVDNNSAESSGEHNDPNKPVDKNENKEPVDKNKNKEPVDKNKNKEPVDKKENKEPVNKVDEKPDNQTQN